MIGGVPSKQLQQGKDGEAFLLLLFGRDASIDYGDTRLSCVDLVPVAFLSLHREVRPL